MPVLSLQEALLDLADEHEAAAELLAPKNPVFAYRRRVMASDCRLLAFGLRLGSSDLHPHVIDG